MGEFKCEGTSSSSSEEYQGVTLTWQVLSLCGTCVEDHNGFTGSIVECCCCRHLRNNSRSYLSRQSPARCPHNRRLIAASFGISISCVTDHPAFLPPLSRLGRNRKHRLRLYHYRIIIQLSCISFINTALACLCVMKIESCCLPRPIHAESIACIPPSIHKPNVYKIVCGGGVSICYVLFKGCFELMYLRHIAL